MMASENGHTAAVGTWLAAAFPRTGCEPPSASSVTGSRGSRAVPLLVGAQGRLPRSCPAARGRCPVLPGSVLPLLNSSCPSSFQSSCCTKQKQI